MPARHGVCSLPQLTRPPSVAWSRALRVEAPAAPGVDVIVPRRELPVVRHQLRRLRSWRGLESPATSWPKRRAIMRLARPPRPPRGIHAPDDITRGYPPWSCPHTQTCAGDPTVREAPDNKPLCATGTPPLVASQCAKRTTECIVFPPTLCPPADGCGPQRASAPPSAASPRETLLNERNKICSSRGLGCACPNSVLVIIRECC